MAETAAQRQARKRERKRIRGLVRAEVWIPDTPEARQKLAECVSEMFDEKRESCLARREILV